MRRVLLLLLIAAAFLFVSCTKDPCETDTCWFEKALQDGDEFLCSKIENTAIRRACYSEIGIAKMDLDICRAYNSSYCITLIAEKSKDPQLCRTIAEETWHDTCLSSLALSLNETPLCRDLQNPAARDDCHDSLAKLRNTTDTCMFIVDPVKRDQCVSKRAISTFDSNGCFLIRDPFMRDGCYDRIARYTGKIRICDNIQIEQIRYFCKRSFQNKTAQ